MCYGCAEPGIGTMLISNGLSILAVGILVLFV